MAKRRKRRKDPVTEDLPLFAPVKTMSEARAERDAGMALGESAALAPAWRRYADGFLEGYLRGHPEMFCDDVWTAGLTPPAPGKSMRLFGSVVQGAVRKGWIENTGRLRASVRSRCGPKPIWRSLLYGGNGS